MTWSSHRGDEWWYTGSMGKLEGSCDGVNFCIGSIPKGMHGYKKELLHSFLLETFTQLKGLKITVSCDSELEAALRSLESDKLISIEIKKSPYGNSAVIKTVSERIVASSPVKVKNKVWWKLW